jgi:hypothetical protein
MRVYFLVIIMQDNQSAIIEALVKIASLRGDRSPSASIALELENIALKALLPYRDHAVMNSGVSDSVMDDLLEQRRAEVKRRAIGYLSWKNSAYLSAIIQNAGKRNKLRHVARDAIHEMIKSGEIVPVIGSDCTATKFYKLP